MALSKNKHEILCEWIRENLIRQKTYNTGFTTGEIRTCFEQLPGGFYVDNCEFNEAMADCGYIPKSTGNPPYCYYTVSDRSPPFVRYYGRG